MTITTDTLFERARRVGSPFGRRPTGRQLGMFALLCVLLACIGGYWYLTDSERVKRMAEEFLKSGVGDGRVRIRHATLSVFEGLRLDDVTIRTPDNEPDSEIFSAGTVVVKFSLRSLMARRIEATQIIVHDARIRFCEDLDKREREWNHQRLWAPGPATKPASQPSESKPAVLPEVLLRGARWEYSRIKNGRYFTVGSMALDGRLTPTAESNRYHFDLSGRAAGQTVGPSLVGSADFSNMTVQAIMRDLELNPVIQALFPAQTQAYMLSHQLTGRVAVPLFSYKADKATGKPDFHVEVELDRVSMAALPEEMMDPAARLHVRQTRLALDGARAAGLDLAPRVDALEAILVPPSIRLGQVVGKLIFTPGGIELHNITGSVENNSFSIAGQIKGYDPSSPFDLTINAGAVSVPPNPQYVRSMPVLVQEVYRRLRPQGLCAARDVKIGRAEYGGPVRVEGRVQVLDGSFVFDKFPYPLHHVSGEVAFGRDPASGWDWIKVRGIKGCGPAGTPNENAQVLIEGTISPLNDENDIRFHIVGRNVTLDPPLRGALPPEAQEAVRLFDPTHKGLMPYVHGNFDCQFVRPGGPVSSYYTDIDVDADDAAGALVYFPYPMEHVSGRLRIRRDHVEIVGARMTRGDASMVVDGTIGFDGGQIAPDLRIDAKSVPIDKMLLDALPADHRQWLAKSGLSGKLDVEGRISAPATRPAVGQASSLSAPVGQASSLSPPGSDRLEARPTAPLDVVWDLNLALHEGRVWPADGGWALTEMAGKMRLDNRYLRVDAMTARRGAAQVSGTALMDFLAPQPLVSLRAAATGLAMDRPLYRLLPAAGQAAWEQLQPEGSVDVDVAVGPAVAKQRADLPASGPATQPADDPFRLVLRPRKLAVTLRSVPYRLEDLAGTVIVTPAACQLVDLTGRHGAAKIQLSGRGVPEGGGGLANQAPTVWELRVAGQGLPVDDDLRHASPPALASLFDALKVQGTLSFDCPTFAYRPAGPQAASEPAAQALAGGQIDFQTKVSLADGSLDMGIPLAAVAGDLVLTGAVRDGRLGALSGTIDVPSLELAGRSMKRLHAELLKPADRDRLQIAKLEGELAGGKLAGQIDMLIPPTGASSYWLAAVLHDADVRELAKEGDVKARGQITASLNLEGVWGQPARRRGQGNVQVRGKDLYRIPVVLGLLEITNLALPISSPFSEATARYNVQGQRVTFEQIELRSDNMSMLGNGWLDFGSRKVKMTFITDNPNWPKLPFLSDLLLGARQELLQIQVNGTVQAPEVSAKALNTFTTTVDEVLKGNSTPPKKPK